MFYAFKQEKMQCGSNFFTNRFSNEFEMDSDNQFPNESFSIDVVFYSW